MSRSARALGCDPKKHFKFLIEGKSVTLDNGKVIHARDVNESVEASKVIMIIILEDEDKIQRFVDQN